MSTQKLFWPGFSAWASLRSVFFFLHRLADYLELVWVDYHHPRHWPPPHRRSAPSSPWLPPQSDPGFATAPQTLAAPRSAIAVPLAPRSPAVCVLQTACDAVHSQISFHSRLS